VEIEQAELAIQEPSEEVIALDEALTKLAQKDRIAAELIKLRYFTGLTLEHAGKILGIPPRTADRYWAYARAWLYREIIKGKE
jgi:RNA polymerase sigma factor (sigma-70 family)